MIDELRLSIGEAKPGVARRAKTGIYFKNQHSTIINRHSNNRCVTQSPSPPPNRLRPKYFIQIEIQIAIELGEASPDKSGLRPA